MYSIQASNNFPDICSISSSIYSIVPGLASVFSQHLAHCQALQRLPSTSSVGNSRTTPVPYVFPPNCAPLVFQTRFHTDILLLSNDSTRYQKHKQIIIFGSVLHTIKLRLQSYIQNNASEYPIPSSYIKNSIHSLNVLLPHILLVGISLSSSHSNGKVKFHK